MASDFILLLFNKHWLSRVWLKLIAIIVKLKTQNERNDAMHSSKYVNQLQYMEKSPIFLYDVHVLNETNNNLSPFTPFHKNYLKHFYIYRKM